MKALTWQEEITPSGTDRHTAIGNGWNGRIAYIGGKIGYVATLFCEGSRVWEERNLPNILSAKFALTDAARREGLL